MAEQKGIQETFPSGKDTKSSNLTTQIKEKNGTRIHGEKSPYHDKETHGTSDDINEDTPVDEVKGPGVLGRVKEEIEAVVEAVHPKK